MCKDSTKNKKYRNENKNEMKENKPKTYETKEIQTDENLYS